MKAHEFTNNFDAKLESYLARWDADVAKPLLEWQRMLSEAELTPDQINALFGDISTRTKDLKTATGKVAGVAAKGAKLAAKALPTNVAAKIHEIIKDTKPVKDFDAAFERVKANLINKLGGDDSKIVQYTTSLAKMAKDHPVMGAAIIGVLTTAAAVATGGVGAGIVGALLKTGNELLKGESLSQSLASGAGAGAVGALAGWGVDELAQWMPGMSFDTDNLPGYTNLVDVKMLHNINGITDFHIDVPMTKEAYAQVSRLAEIAHKTNDYAKAARIYRNIMNIYNDPDYIANIAKIVHNDATVLRAAKEGAAKMARFWGGVADAAQGGATAAAGPNDKTATAESIKLNEADIKGIASSIANWAKTPASQATQQITPEKLGKAWRSAGSITDSDQVYEILSKAGVPADVLAAAYAAQNITVPAAQAAQKPATAAENLPIKTGDPAEDAKVKEIYSTQGKDAAVAYLKTLLTQAQNAAAASTTANLPAATQGMKLQASDGKSYELSIGNAGDRLWLDVATRGEASNKIDSELSKKIAPPPGAPAAPAAPTQPAPAAPVSTGVTQASKQAFQQRAAAAKTNKARPIRESIGTLTDDAAEKGAHDETQ